MKKVIAGVVVAGAAVFGVTACTAEEPEQTPTPEPTVEQTPDPEQTPTVEPETDSDSAGPAEVTSDGVFEYEVSEARIASEYVDTWDDVYYPDEDQFVVMDVSATNVSNRPAYAPDPWTFDHVMAEDSEGRMHMADDEPWTDDLQTNPGGTVTYSVVWDVPEDVKLTHVELASMDANGVAYVEVK